VTVAAACGLMAQAPQAAPAQPAGQAGPKTPQVKSQAEGQAVQALLQSQQGGPDAMIKAAEELLTKFADTEFKEIALFVESQAYKAKGDNTKAQIFAERVLEVDPQNFQATLLIGEVLVSSTRENDLDKEEKLGRGEKLLNQTIDILKTAPKPNPQLPDDQWAEAKKFMSAEAHNDLGLSALTRKKYDVAIVEFKTAQDLDPQPAYQVRLASAYQSAGKNDEAIALVDKLLTDPQLHPQIKAVAQNVKQLATQAKAKPAPKQ
jgi:tetratricopeptide (TPR) repeat protein